MIALVCTAVTAGKLRLSASSSTDTQKLSPKDIFVELISLKDSGRAYALALSAEGGMFSPQPLYITDV